MSGAIWCLLRTVAYVLKKLMSGAQQNQTASFSSSTLPPPSVPGDSSQAALHEALFESLELLLALSDRAARARLARTDGAVEALDRLARGFVPSARHYIELDPQCAALVRFLSSNTSLTLPVSIIQYDFYNMRQYFSSN